MRVVFEEMPWATSPAVDRHRPRAVTDRVRMIFVEEAS
jgi:hypothetical protein